MADDPTTPESMADRLIRELPHIPESSDDLWCARQLHVLFGFPVSTVAQACEQPVSTVSRRIREIGARLDETDTGHAGPLEVLRVVHATGHLAWDLLRISMHYGGHGDQLDRARGICRAVRGRVPESIPDLLHHERTLLAYAVTVGCGESSLLDEADRLALVAGDSRLLNVEHKLLGDFMCAQARDESDAAVWERMLLEMEDYGQMNPAIHVVTAEHARGLESAAQLAEKEYGRLVEQGRPLSLVFTVARYRWEAGHPRKALRLLQALDRRGLSEDDRTALDGWLEACRGRLAGEKIDPPRRRYGIA